MVILLLVSSLYFVDQPYPSPPGHGLFDVELRFGPDGGILCYFNVGVWDRFGLGLSYGASNLIGYGDPEFYEQPGVQIRALAIEEDMVYPSLFFGFDNQGYGDYTGRYDIRSKGLYFEVSKSLGFANIVIVPGLGLNYCFESDNGLDLFSGFMAQFGRSGALLVDYSLNLNDPTDQNKGYLNVGLRLLFYGEMFFEFSLRDLLSNNIADQQFNRCIKMGFEQRF